jgi:hypothetical protein
LKSRTHTDLDRVWPPLVPEMMLSYDVLMSPVEIEQFQQFSLFENEQDQLAEREKPSMAPKGKFSDFIVYVDESGDHTMQSTDDKYVYRNSDHSLPSDRKRKIPPLISAVTCVIRSGC